MTCSTTTRSRSPLAILAMKDELFFKPLIDYLHLLPGMDDTIGSGALEDGGWWVKFHIDIGHPLAWNVVQELGHVLNYVSIHERLPTVFKPVSPPPYLNGGPKDVLSWVIECKDQEFLPRIAPSGWRAGCRDQ